MAEMPKIETKRPDELRLDPKNPRLGRHEIEKGLSQEQILEQMKEWALDELAVSFLESGFWPQEALICVREKVGKKQELVVVEGNRRLAALRIIEQTRAGEERSAKWRQLVSGYPDQAFERLAQVPYLLFPSRDSVQAFLGFRHVTGIKEWNPSEKAEFIAHLIEKEGLDYDQVRKRIGSKTATVRQNYIAFNVLRQMEKDDEIDLEKVEERFSVLYLALRSGGVQRYLGIDGDAAPSDAKTPVPKDKSKQLQHFARWVFGTSKNEPMIEDSRQLDTFARFLGNVAAVDYLERTDKPLFQVAKRITGEPADEVAGHVERAAQEAEEALSYAHHHKESKRLQQAVKRLGADALQLLDLFPAIKDDLLKR